MAKADRSVARICKPTGLNQGKGIFLVPDAAAFETELAKEPRGGVAGAAASAARLIQRYVPNPLLINGKKFGASTAPPTEGAGRRCVAVLC